MAERKRRIITPLKEIESLLIGSGFVCKERKTFEDECKRDPHNTRWKNPPRFKYRKGAFVVLTESNEQPWRTVQKMSGGSVLWYVDFPLDVEKKAILEFVEVD